MRTDTLTEVDFTLQNEGSIFVLHPENDWARGWIEEHLYSPDGDGPQWWGGGVVIEHRFIADIVYAITAEGGRGNGFA